MNSLFEWWKQKEKIKKIREELPVFVTSLRWLLGYYPVQEAICMSDFGEVSKLMHEVCRRYLAGASFESALKDVFPSEFEELVNRLILIYKTGKGLKLLDLYSEKLLSQNLVRVKERSARIQIFSVAYTSFAAILPAMASGFSMSFSVGHIEYAALFLSSLLVVLWKVLD